MEQAFKTRSVSSLFIFLIFVSALLSGGFWFVVFIKIIGFLTIYELYGLLFTKNIPHTFLVRSKTTYTPLMRIWFSIERLVFLPHIGFVFLAFVLTSFLTYFGWFGAAFLLDCVIFGADIFYVVYAQKQRCVFNTTYARHILKVFFFYVYGLFPFAVFIALRNGAFVWPVRPSLAEGGALYGLGAPFFSTLYLCCLVWLADVGAYLTGQSLGGPKLCPSISPGKTWSGLAGAFVFSVMGAWIYGAFIFHLTGSMVSFLLGAAFLCLVSQVGDLFESWLKRRANVKDSGHIIPGHGGVLDRLDGLIFVLFSVGLFLLVVHF